MSTRAMSKTPVARAKLYSLGAEIKADPAVFLLAGNLAQNSALVCGGSPNLDLNCLGGGPANAAGATPATNKF